MIETDRFIPFRMDCIRIRSRGPNGAGWADENEPMGYQALAQPTHGFFSKNRPSPAHPWAAYKLKIFFEIQLSLLYWAKLSIIVIYSLIPEVKTKLMSEKGERGNYILLKKAKVSTRINSLTSINILLTQNSTKSTRRSKLVTCLRQLTLSVWC